MNTYTTANHMKHTNSSIGLQAQKRPNQSMDWLLLAARINAVENDTVSSVKVGPTYYRLMSLTSVALTHSPPPRFPPKPDIPSTRPLKHNSDRVIPEDGRSDGWG